MVKERLVHFLDAVYDHADEDVVGGDAVVDESIDVVSDAHECPFQHSLVLTVHAHANGQLHPLRLLQQRNIVVLVRTANLLHRCSPGDLGQGRQLVLVVGDAVVFDGDEHALGKGICGDGGVGGVGPEREFHGLHEADVDEVFEFDLRHEVPDHLLVLALHQQQIDKLYPHSCFRP